MAEIQTLTISPELNDSISFISDVIIVCPSPSDVIMFDREAGKAKFTLANGPEMVTAMAVSEDGTMVVVAECSKDGSTPAQITIFDVRTLRKRKVGATAAR